MAVAVAEAQASISKKISLGGGTYLYIGTLAFGTEYATGGDTLGTASGERYSLPEKIDYLTVENAGGFVFDYAGGKVQAFWTGTALKGILEQVAAKTSLAGVTAAPFICIGT